MARGLASTFSPVAASLLGAFENHGALVVIGDALYVHHDSLRADDVARAAWKKWPVARQLTGNNTRPLRGPNG